jgi:hypothetical protein
LIIYNTVYKVNRVYDILSRFLETLPWGLFVVAGAVPRVVGAENLRRRAK